MRYRRCNLPDATYFFTVVTQSRTPIFCQPSAVQLYERAVRQVRTWHPFAVEAEVILPDHIHTIWSLPEGDADFSTRWMLIKTSFSRSYHAQDGQEFVGASRRSKRERGVWQRRFWEHLIRDEKDFIAHADYIHINPVKHGFVRAAMDWPHSTFREFVARGIYTRDWGSDAMPELPDWVGKE